MYLVLLTCATLQLGPSNLKRTETLVPHGGTDFFYTKPVAVTDVEYSCDLLNTVLEMKSRMVLCACPELLRSVKSLWSGHRFSGSFSFLLQILCDFRWAPNWGLKAAFCLFIESGRISPILQYRVRSAVTFSTLLLPYFFLISVFSNSVFSFYSTLTGSTLQQVRISTQGGEDKHLDFMLLRNPVSNTKI